MDVGIVGMAGSGRTQVFSALLAHRSAKTPGERKAASVGAIHVQDPRLDRLSELFKPKKTTPIEIRVHDLCPSLEPGFPTAELEAMKRMDVLALVVPQFLDATPAAGVAALDRLVGELCLEDLAAVERRVKRATREKIDDTTKRALERAQESLEAELPVHRAELAPAEHEALRGSGLITDRPMLVLCNVGEDQAGEPVAEEIAARASRLGAVALPICATLEAEMAELPATDRAAFLAEYAVEEPAGAAVTRAILEQGQTIPFFTVGEDECRAWAIPRGTLAKHAAGKIHSDIERGFIRAEVIGYDVLEPLGGNLAAAKKTGQLRLEGKDYVVEDGDVINFRFNV